MESLIKKNVLSFLLYKKFVFVSLFYVAFKNFFVNYGKFLTYIYILYAFFCIAYFLFIKKNVLNFRYRFSCFGLCFITIISIIVNKKFNIENISLTSIIIINFLILSNCFVSLKKEEIYDTVDDLFKIISYFSFFWAIFGIVLSILNISFDFFGVEFGMLKSAHRLQLLRPSVNPTGHFALCSIGCCVYCYLNSNKNKFVKCFYLINVILLLIVIYFTNSIETIIAFIISIVFSLFILFLLNKRIKRKYAYLIAFCIFVFLIIVFVIKYIDFNVFHFHTFLERIDIISVSIYILRKTNLLFGSSFGGLIDDWLLYKNEALNNVRYLTDYFQYVDFVKYAINTHNSYIHLLISIGIVGFAFFSLYIINVLFDVMKIIIKTPYFDLIKILPLFFIILSTLIIGLASDSLFTTMTEFPNLFFFVSSSAITQFNKNISGAKVAK